MSFITLVVIGFIFGIGFGYFVQRSGLCFANGLGEIFIGKGKRICRLFIIIFVITASGFLVSKLFSPSLGLKTIGQLRGYGLYNVLSGIFFGAGIFLNGGCILGTLRQMGEGNMTFLVVFVSFIPGMALIVYVIDPLLQHGYDVHNMLLPEVLGVPAVYVTGVLVFAAIGWFWMLRKRKKR